MLRTVLERAVKVRAAEVEGAEAAEAGFTLIELMVVLLIIAILLAIAIPTFLGVTNSANDRATQSNLTNALTEASAQYQANGQSYTNITSYGNSSAPEYTWLTGITPINSTNCSKGTTNCISAMPVDVAAAYDQAGVVIAGLSKTGVCWLVLTLSATPAAAGWSETQDVPFTPFSSVGTGTGAVSAGGTYYSEFKPTSAQYCEANAAFPGSYGATNTWEWATSYTGATTLVEPSPAT